MRELLVFIKYNFKRFFRKKSNILSYLVVPIAISVFLVSQGNGAGSGRLKIGIENKDGGKLSQNLIDNLKTEEKISVITVKAEDIKKDIIKENIDLAITIPEDFTEAMYKGEDSKIELITLKGEETTAFIGSSINLYINNLKDIYKASKGNREVFNKIYSNYKANGFKFEKEILKDESNAKKASATLLGFFLMFMFICSSATSRFILKDKIDKTYHRICMTKVDRKKYILGNILSNFFILMIQSTLGFLIIQKGLKFNTQAYFIDILIVLWSFALCSVSLSMVIITFAKSTNSVTVLNSLIVTPTCMLGGCFWPRELMGDTLKKISNFIPQTWAVDALNKAIEGESIKTFYINILILIGFSAIFFLLALYKSNLENNTKNFI